MKKVIISFKSKGNKAKLKFSEGNGVYNFFRYQFNNVHEDSLKYTSCYITQKKLLQLTHESMNHEGDYAKNWLKAIVLDMDDNSFLRVQFAEGKKKKRGDKE